MAIVFPRPPYDNAPEPPPSLTHCHACGEPTGGLHAAWCSAVLRAATPEQPHKAPHYNDGDIECIDAIRAALTPEEFRGFCKGNVLKYVWRERHKGGDESLAKAVDYLDYAQGAPRG